MGAHVSIVARQTTEASNAKEFLQDRTRLRRLFEDIVVFDTDTDGDGDGDRDRELDEGGRCRNGSSGRGRVSLSAIVLFFQNHNDEFVTENIMPSDLDDSNMIAILLDISYCYAVRRDKNHDSNWCKFGARWSDKVLQQRTNVSFAVFESLMCALFYFSHLFDIFVSIGQGIGGLTILLGEFLRAHDQVQNVPGVVVKRSVPLEVWGDEFEGMRSTDVISRESRMNFGVENEDVVTFYEFCQYVAREIVSPAVYLERSWKQHDIPRTCTKSCAQGEKAVEQPVSCIEGGGADTVPPSNNVARSSRTTRDVKTPLRAVGGELSHIAEETPLDLDPAHHLEDNNSCMGSIASSTMLFASRGRIRPTSAPPPPPQLNASVPGYRPLPPTVFNGRDITSNKKAMRKKYNQLHQYKLDPRMESNFTPSNFPKKIPQNRGLPKRLLPVINLQVPTKNDVSHSHYSTTAEGSRMTLHLQVPFNNSFFSIEEKPSVCSATICDLSMSMKSHLA